jgi:hypothetical protein
MLTTRSTPLNHAPLTLHHTQRVYEREKREEREI